MNAEYEMDAEFQESGQMGARLPKKFIYYENTESVIVAFSQVYLKCPKFAGCKLFCLFHLVSDYSASFGVTCGHHAESINDCRLSRPGLPL